MNTLLELLEQDCTQSPAQLAAQAGMTEVEAKDELRRLEEEGVILGYQAVIDWDRVKRENVTALIEVKVTPQSLAGFDRIAERIYQYDEVESMYLMSGLLRPDSHHLWTQPAGGSPVCGRAPGPTGGGHRHGHPFHFEKI